ncbi:hypothetical protein SAMD00019534_106690 [Acytostelium subglobosum LB1]|uniref:hypothetical protein n=1 Tax=Acytostelium subglobosum LB1 TaxID=1410327 RepID=UPI000644CC84|nr:hypothetical protein SAMD00019534_106690 [Acytostelium subglobosum LB1]GAM27493.1 hypothetical protein SAMD00019534_106690 [Acytostelium subglobosum LB1]|eukprot:XP_012749558.1 hypothetical protein SAMD00019534_106690 [Acytostelium subglobosum LB1]
MILMMMVLLMLMMTLTEASKLQLSSQCARYDTYDSFLVDTHRFSRCVLRSPEHRLKAFEQLFHSFSAQQYSTDIMKNALSKKLIKPNEPIVIMSTGDHGLGKTRSAKLLYSAMFENAHLNNNGDGLLIIHGEEYRLVRGNDEPAVTRARRDLHDKIRAQLDKCPESLILLDEIQKIHPDVLSVLEPFFEGLTMSNNVITNRAIYVLTSDFGLEGSTKGKTSAEVVEMVIKFSNMIYKDTKIMSLVTDIAPFRALSASETDELLLYHLVSEFCQSLRLQGMSELTLTNQEATMAFLRRHVERLYASENVRGIEKSVEHHILNNVTVHLANNQALYKGSEPIAEQPNGWFDRHWRETGCHAIVNVVNQGTDKVLEIEYKLVTEDQHRDYLSPFKFVAKKIRIWK